jgi:hypothetical protein
MGRSVSVQFPRVHAVEMTDSLAENLKLSLNGFRSHAIYIYIHISKSPFSVEISDALEKFAT